MTWDPGSILAAATLGLTVVWQLWDRIGKGNADAFVRSEGERDRLEKRVQELEKSRDEDRARLDKVETELEALRLDHKTVLDFLKDIVSGRFDEAWVRGRAQDLLDRLGGTK